MFDGNALLNELIGKNWLLILLAYHILNAAFPNWQFLDRLAKGVGDLFPIFKRGNNGK